MLIDRCYCYQKTFKEIKEVAVATGSETIPQLQQHIGFGGSCRLCHPYVNDMLKSGVTEFDHVIEPDPLGAQTQRDER